MRYSHLILLAGFFSMPAVILAQANLFNFGGSYHAGAKSNYVAVADLNADGRPDLVIASHDTRNLTVLLGNGSGTFTESAGSPFAAGASPTSVTVGDFNSDGHPDITVTEATGAVRLFLGRGDGQFTEASGSPFPVPGLDTVTSAARDMNGDGRLDLVVATALGLNVLIGDGAGGFIPAVNLVLHGSGVNAFAVADLNGDGNLDIAFTDSSWVYLELGDGHGVFHPDFQSGFRTPGSIASGDLNGDGIPDLVFYNGGSVTVWYLSATGQNVLPAAARNFFLGYAGALVTGDFNGDGKLDWAAALSNSNSVAVMLNDGAGGFNPAPGSPYAVGITPISIAIGDFNGDGKLDIVTGNQNDVTVLLNSALPPALLTLKNAASYASSASFSPDTIMYGEATKIAPSLFVAPDGPWPASLGGASVSIIDSLGQARSAPVYYVAPNAVSFLMPSGLAPGRATAKLTTTSGVSIIGPVNIEKISPGIFTANANGLGVAAGLWIRVAADGTQTSGYLFDPAQPLGQRQSVFVDLGAVDAQVFLSLYGTGFRGATQARATISGIMVPVAGFAAVGAYQGEDVINLGPLPRTFLGGEVELPVTIVFDNQAANTVTVAIH